MSLKEHAAATAGSGVIVALLHHLAGVQLAESVLEIGEGAFCLADLGVVSAEDIGVASRLAEELGGLEELALGLDALVDILDLLVQLVRLGDVVRDGHGGMGANVTIATKSELPHQVWREEMDVQDRGQRGP